MKIEKILTNHLLSGTTTVIIFLIFIKIFLIQYFLNLHANYFIATISLTGPYKDYEYYTVKIPECLLSSRYA